LPIHDERKVAAGSVVQKRSEGEAVEMVLKPLKANA
jgi:hypothetical protein